MATKDKNPARGQYGEVVSRLQQIVEALEGGELSLEDSLERFQEGVGLVKQGEAILNDAEKRIEQLLSEDGRTAPLKVSETPAEPPRQAPPPPPKKAPPPPPAEDDDVPF
ncbi:MAG: exodeoxyribonuclease VII small subunit [Myxococcota bacterium]